MQKVDVYIKTSARGPAVRKHIAYMYVLKIVINGKEFVRKWEKDGWKKKTGKPVKNADLWQQYLNVSRGHVISWSDEPHDFTKWMEYELKKMEAEYVRI